MNWLANVQILEKLQVKVTLCDAMRTLLRPVLMHVDLQRACRAEDARVVEDEVAQVKLYL